MTYCKDCRTEFMVAEDEPCPRCGRYLGGARVGQRVVVERPAQAEQAAQAEASGQADQADQVEEQVEQVAQSAAGGWGALRFRAVAWTWWLCVLLNPFAAWREISLLPPEAQGWWAKFLADQGVLSRWSWSNLLPLESAYCWTLIVGVALGAWALWWRLRRLRWNAAWMLVCLVPWGMVEAMSLRGTEAAALLTLNSAVLVALGLRWNEAEDLSPVPWRERAWKVVLGMWGLPTLMLVLAKTMPREWIQGTVVAVLFALVVAWLEKGHQRVAQTWRPAGESTASASSPAAALNAVPALKPAPPSARDEDADGCAALVLLAVLAIPAFIGYWFLWLLQEFQGTPYMSALWLLYLSVFLPPLFFWKRPLFWPIWLLWCVVAVAAGLFFYQF